MAAKKRKKEKEKKKQREKDYKAFHKYFYIGHFWEIKVKCLWNLKVYVSTFKLYKRVQKIKRDEKTKFIYDRNFSDI